jgi:FkbM family methyltransferase
MSSAAATPVDFGVSLHHPSIRAITPATVLAHPAFEVDFLGTRTRRAFSGGRPQTVDLAEGPRPVTPPYPSFDEEYFEWIDVLESVEEASDHYVIVEIGAGYGRWSMRAASAVRRKPGCRFHCVAVEAEPDHFRYLLEHFRDNGVDPSSHEVTWAAVSRSPGFVPFRIGSAGEWYGQRIAPDPPVPMPDVRERRRLKARSVLARPPLVTGADSTVMWVPCVTLAEVLASHARIDLLDIDVQRAELDVLEPAMDRLDERVRRIHIGTHTPRLERRLRELFRAHGWTSIHDYPCHRPSVTPYGEVTFADGVQTWLNPSCGRASVQHRNKPRAGVLVKRLQRLQIRNLTLRSQRDGFRARCRALEEKVARLKASRSSPFAAILRFLTRPAWKLRRR